MKHCCLGQRIPLPLPALNLTFPADHLTSVTSNFHLNTLQKALSAHNFISEHQPYVYVCVYI